MANKVKAKLALQLREAEVSANKVHAAHRISKKSQKEVLEAAARLPVSFPAKLNSHYTPLLLDMYVQYNTNVFA